METRAGAGMNRLDAPGLLEHLESAGFWLMLKTDINNNDSWEYPPTAQPLIDAYTLADAKKHVKRQLQEQVTTAYERTIVALYGSKPHDLESNSWRLKEIQARNWDEWDSGGQAGTEPSTSEIDPRVTTANPMAVEVGRIIAKADFLHAQEAAIQANSQVHEEAIDDAADVDALLAVQINTGWPY